MLHTVWLVPALPLAGFLLLVLFGRRLAEPKAGWLAATMCGASFFVTLLVFLDMVSKSAEERSHVVRVFSWIPVGSLQVDLAFLADQLSITMALFVTGIGTLIHLYAIGYMHGDPKFSKFFIYLNLFVFSMLMLVLGENLLVTFLGWEGVGTCSYFLISFWHTRDSAATAGKKAFVTNRVGDWGFMMAMFLAFGAVGTLSYGTINSAAQGGSISHVTATAIALMLFVGACGKSAQLPLYLWLPDAMEGPTPVSALIHAATMVTAGVFLMTRMNPVIAEAYHWAPTIIAVIGAATALFAATVAVAQNDIKKVLAYSTVSQLGYMFLAVGSGAYVAAIFHMITHAFFKALLFLGSGSVIHGMHHEQDMRKMGALRVLMPVTGFTFIIGWLAIAGVPPFAGFWSKDEILLYVFANNRALYVVGLVTALLTAFYMTRQVIMVFFGEAKWKDHSEEHGAHGDFVPHESPRIMLFPLVVLAVLSVGGGLLQLPFTKDLHFLEKWLEPIVEHGEAHISGSWAYDNKYLLMLGAIVVALGGIALAVGVYGKKKLPAIEPQILANAWNYDKGVSAFMGGPGRQSFEGVAWADAHVIDGAVRGTGSVVRKSSGLVRKIQSGYVRVYAAAIVIGVLAMLAWFMWRGVA
ncbi:MAG: NADH-quinone oxidoreductase subunit L [Ilumatobacteraceae bacterium]|jgi:NADH-quinone oxidoreductase subunit L|nr:NADH-quinone oxidoreductase subunit L [Ilumatobacteraceae bacterium]MDP4702451.1 NADH-quinone oxidoreductase subunit L [Ilumatobacteraceae bacterium]MDP5109463.1 NADH-quinone oxidoreductase subunit L [Ilumatobacteraceae bacterium]